MSGAVVDAGSGPSPRVTVVGDTLLDRDWTGVVERLCPDAPAPVLDQRGERARPGGAGLAALFAAAEGARVTLVTALGDDAEGDLVRSLLGAAGVAVVDLGLAGPTPVKLRIRADDRSLVRVDRGCAPVVAPGPWCDAAGEAVLCAQAVLVSDYGRGLTAVSPFVQLVGALDLPVVWDPHPRGAAPPRGLDLLVPNRAEGARLAADSTGDAPRPGAEPHDPTGDDRSIAAALARRYGCPVALTVGRHGAVVAAVDGSTTIVPVEPVRGDACGAGDRFAAAATVARAGGVGVVEAVARAAAAARDHVAAREDAAAGFAGRGQSRDGTPSLPGLQVPASGVLPGAGAGAVPAAASARTPDAAVAAPRRAGTVGVPEGRSSGAVALARSIRAAGGTVVVAGGCFDVLHAGHVRLLEAARRLGDCLVVCLNSDLSVRRLKGRRRPVNPVGDRAEVLQALGPVDAVHVFDEDDPCAALELLRPHLFVKGADHAGVEIPERAVLAAWGGEVVFVPLVPGRSTTRVIEIAAGAAAS